MNLRKFCSSSTFHGILILDVLVMNFTLSSVSALGNETDKIALQEFKSLLTDNSAGILTSWSDSLPVCQWTGVTCGHRHQRVFALNLEGQDLSGTMSPYHGNLTFLRFLNLANNSLHGQIPPEIGLLFRLQNLTVSHNALLGQIPRNLSRCLNLMRLELDYNFLNDQIPPELGMLAKLQVLSLSVNNLTGVIPASLGNISLLQELYLLSNNLGGQVPYSISQTSLQFFVVSENFLTGGFPSALYNLSSLTTIRMYSNLFTGKIRNDIGLFLPNLQKLIMGDNQFTGFIPDSLSNASNLALVDIPDNNLTGSIPASFGKLQNLIKLDLFNNSLGSSITDSLSFLNYLANCSSLGVLDFSFNLYDDELPISVANLSAQLTWLRFIGNTIRGNIPEGISNLVNLNRLSMDQNFLAGSIPLSIGKLSKLKYLSLGANKLTGKIPSTIGNITQLLHLYLYNNSLEGNIPSSLGDSKSLQDLHLCHNKLVGTIPSHLISPSSLLLHLNVSHNSLSGPVPPDVGNVKGLLTLDVSYNQFSGGIPSSLDSCLGLEELHMQANHLQGPIPMLSGLRGIQFIDLSSNDLSGEIPEYMVQFLSLQFLNLSFNNLEGEVPVQEVFQNASAFDVQGNRKLCGGITELHLVSCSIGKSRKHISLKWMAVIISCASCMVAVLFSLCLYWFTKSKENLPIHSFGHFHQKVSYVNLFNATNGFSSGMLIGSGNFGGVFKGTLGQEGKVVAVKVLNLQQKGAFKSFLAECKALGNVRHRNLVKILTACSSIDSQGNEFKALMYEYMANGDLDMWLHPKDDEMQSRHLSFLQRLNIIIDVAFALDYLHHQCENALVHCDLKPSNILLDDDLIAHISDFGLSRLLLMSDKEHFLSYLSSSALNGTMGYVAPEYGMGMHPSTSGDVYSFGILVLEMFTGRRPTDVKFQEDLNLHKFVKLALPERATDIMDQPIFSEVGESSTEDESFSTWDTEQKECLKLAFEIGVNCSVESPRDRKDMSGVATELLSIRDRFLKTGVYEGKFVSPMLGALIFLKVDEVEELCG